MTDMIRKGEILTMQRYTTQKGYDQIFKDTILSINDPRLSLLQFGENDVKKMYPIRVNFVERNHDPHIFIDMFFAMIRSVKSMEEVEKALVDLQTIEEGLKTERKLNIPENDRANRLILAEIFTRFHRDYSKEPDWDIEFFKIAKLKIIYSKK